MKVGILTYYGDLNCGTNLQAYATLQAVKSAYPDALVEVIPFHGFRMQIRPYKSFSPVSVFRDAKRIYKYHLFKKKTLNVKEKDIIEKNVAKALRYLSERNYDVIYVGADTLLELDRLPKNCETLSAYWLTNVETKKILIAASAKSTEYEKLFARQKEEMKTAVAQFSYMGVRDRATLKLLSHFVEENRVEYVPDPTFTMKIEYSHTEKYLKKKGITILPKSVFIHTYGSDYWAYDVAGALKKEGYQIVAPRPAKWADLHLNDMSPFEQSGIYRYFEFALTHRFHDGVFCLKNNTPVILYEKGNKHATATGDSKYTSLLKDFDLYPDGFAGRDTDITVDLILDKKQKLIANFRAKEEIIKNKLQVKKEEYLNFLNKTVMK